MSTLTAQEKGLQVLKAVYGSASESYRQTMGEPTATMNLTDYAKPLLAEADEYQPIQNEFIKTLINRIVATIIEDKLYNNNLSVLKKGYLAPLGTDIQHIYTNPINPRKYDGDNLSGILTKYDNDTKVAYYRRNRTEVYPISVNREQLAGAFVSWEKFNSFISNLVNAVYSGAEIREQSCFKQAIVNAIAGNRIVLRQASFPDETNSKALVAEIKNVSSQMSFASSAFNKYKELVEAETGETVQPVVTWTPKDRQVIIMRSDILNALSVEVLASAFNMTEAEFRYNLIEVDNFGFDQYNLETGVISGHIDSDIGFLIADISLFQIYDNLKRTVSDFLGYSLTWQFFLHIWQTIGICPFANAVAYRVPAGATKITNMLLSKSAVIIDAETAQDSIDVLFLPKNLTGLTTDDFELKLESYSDSTGSTVVPETLPVTATLAVELGGESGDAEIAIEANTAFEKTVGTYTLVYVLRQKSFEYPNATFIVDVTVAE